jgi:hypothetical protein
MSDVECPYCGEEQEVNHDDGYGYEEGRTYEQKCGDCEKNFAFTTSISFYYATSKADCLNGAEHNYQPVCSTARDIWPDWKRCKDCDYEERGKYVEPKPVVNL